MCVPLLWLAPVGIRAWWHPAGCEHLSFTSSASANCKIRLSPLGQRLKAPRKIETVINLKIQWLTQSLNDKVQISDKRFVCTFFINSSWTFPLFGCNQFFTLLRKISKMVGIGWWASEQCVDDIIQHNNKSKAEIFSLDSFPIPLCHYISAALLNRPNVAGPGAPGDRLPLHPLLLLQLHHAQAEAEARSGSR